MGLPNHGCSCENIGVVKGIADLKKNNCTDPRGIFIACIQQRSFDKVYDDEDFKMVFNLFFIGAILCSNAGLFVKSNDLHRVENVDAIKNANWAMQTYNRLVEGVQK